MRRTFTVAFAVASDIIFPRSGLLRPAITELHAILDETAAVFQLQSFDLFQADVDVRSRQAKILAEHQRVVRGFCRGACCMSPDPEGGVAGQQDAPENSLRNA